MNIDRVICWIPWIVLSARPFWPDVYGAVGSNLTPVSFTHSFPTSISSGALRVRWHRWNTFWAKSVSRTNFSEAALIQSVIEFLVNVAEAFVLSYLYVLVLDFNLLRLRYVF